MLNTRQLRSGVSCSALGCEFSVNESKNMVHLEKKENVFQFVCESPPESAKVTSVVCDEAKEKVGKWLNSWSHEMMNKYKV